MEQDLVGPAWRAFLQAFETQLTAIECGVQACAFCQDIGGFPGFDRAGEDLKHGLDQSKQGGLTVKGQLLHFNQPCTLGTHLFQGFMVVAVQRQPGCTVTAQGDDALRAGFSMTRGNLQGKGHGSFRDQRCWGQIQFLAWHWLEMFQQLARLLKLPGRGGQAHTQCGPGNIQAGFKGQFPQGFK